MISEPSQLPIWVAYFDALGPPIAVVVGAGIAAAFAFWQARAAQFELILRLFEKRLEIYYGALEVIAFIENTASLDREKLERAAFRTTGADWLFGKDFADFLYKKILNNAENYLNQYENLKKLPKNFSFTPSGAEYVKNMQTIRDEILRLPPELRERLKPYLSFEKIRG